MIPVGSIIDLPLPAPFKSRLKFCAFTRESDKQILIELLEPLTVWTRAGFIEIPEGFISDGCSIPPLAGKIVGDPYEFDFLAAAIIHDGLYRKGSFDHVTRAQADLVFRDLLWDSSVPFWKIPLFFAAVRSFGWRFHKKLATEL